MGRRHLLTGQIALIGGNSLATMSWGPFTVPMRIDYVSARTNDTAVNRATVGLYVAGDPEYITSVVAGGTKQLTPDGWTRLTEPSLNVAINDDDFRARDNPFQPAGSRDIVLTDLRLLVFGTPLYIKLLFYNPVVGVASANAWLIVEEVPDADPVTAIAVRPQPGAPPPAPAQPLVPLTVAPPPAPAPAPAKPPTTIIVGAPSPTLPPATQMPRFVIDPADPDESAQQAVT
jgi:hypothetical protein